ncbi:diacylglycerol kinase family protein [Catenuloplanes japonicus]|uniref:diacylglycerol kinase family protein n=1 Tax=Catenuloplanes japonicus TaxID=33876 RepID=UPI000526991B|nr:diacylglycerol kinase family protein [Catenuloplanes japonicus]
MTPQLNDTAGSFSAAGRVVSVLAHPGAGRGRHRTLLPALLEALAGSGHPIRLLDAHDSATAETACRDAVTSGAAAIIAIGGDGTFHRALQSVAGTGTPLGLIPTGTGNDFATAAGLPADPLTAARSVAQALKTGTFRRYDLARVSSATGPDRWFGAVLGAGFDALVNERANRMRFPRGPRRYDLAILAETLTLRPRRYTLRADGGEPRTFDGILVAIGNTSSYGGGLQMCPTADPHDALLDVTIGAPMPRHTLLRLKPRLRTGTHVTDPLVTTLRARTIELSVAAPVVSYADGERCAPLPIAISSVPQALSLALI